MNEQTLSEYFIITCNNEELKEFVENEPHSEGSYLFLIWMLDQFEEMEDYHKCVIVRDEINNRLETYNQESQSG